MHTIADFQLFLGSLPATGAGQVLGTKAQSGIMQYEAVELLLCLSFLIVLSKHRALYKDLLPQLHQSAYGLQAGSIL